MCRPAYIANAAGEVVHAIKWAVSRRYMPVEKLTAMYDDTDAAPAIKKQADASSYTTSRGTINSGGGTTLLVGDLTFTAPLVAGAEFELAAGLGGGLGGSDGGTLLNSASARLSTPNLFRRGDRFTLMLGLPVAVARGSSSITLPVRTRNGSIAQQAIDIDLAPDDREMRLGLEYRYGFAKRSEVVLAVAYANNHGNVAGRRSAAAFAGFTARF